MITPNEERLLGALAASLTALTIIAESDIKINTKTSINVANKIMNLVEGYIPLVEEFQTKKEQKDTP